MNRSTRAYALVLARDLARTLDHALELAFDFDLALHPDLDRDLALHLTHARVLARDLTRDPDPDRHIELARDVDHHRGLARDLALHLARDLARPRELDLAEELVTVLERASERSDLLALSLQDVVPTGAANSANPAPGRMSRGLTALAVRVLPARDRPRYAAEFHTELVELRRRHRLGHALRVLVSAWELRRALADTVPTPDGAPTRRVTER